MSRVLVAFATGTGCTAGVADRIGETLAAKGIQVDVKPFDSRLQPGVYASRLLTAPRSPSRCAYTDKLIAKTGVKPLDIGVFAGWCEPRRFNFLERKILEATKAPEGDFRDWDAIDAWAVGVASKLPATA